MSVMSTDTYKLRLFGAAAKTPRRKKENSYDARRPSEICGQVTQLVIAILSPVHDDVKKALFVSVAR